MPFISQECSGGSHSQCAVPQFQRLCHGKSKLKVVLGICPWTQAGAVGCACCRNLRHPDFFPFMELLPSLSFQYQSQLRNAFPSWAGIPSDPWIWMEAQSLEWALDQAPPVLPSSLSRFPSIPSSLGAGMGAGMCPVLCLSHMPGSEAQTGQEQQGKAVEFQLLDPSCFPSFLRTGSFRGWE